MTTLFTQTQVEELAAAIASGVLEVNYSGPPQRRVVYQSLSEMRKTLAIMRQEIAAASGTKPYRLAAYSKGFGS